MARRHVLGELYGRCDAIAEEIPLYMSGEQPTLLGHVNEALGHYADAFSFFAGDDICKRLVSGHYIYSFGYDPVDSVPGGRIRLTSITLIGRQGYSKPIPRRGATA